MTYSKEMTYPKEFIDEMSETIMQIMRENPIILNDKKEMTNEIKESLNNLEVK